MIFRISLILILFLGNINAQDPFIDSLKTVLVELEPDSIEARVQLLTQITDRYSIINIDSTDQYAQRALRLCEDHNLVIEKLSVLRFLSRAYANNGKFEEARGMASEMKDIADETEDKHWQVLTRLGLATFDKMLGQTESSLTNFQEANDMVGDDELGFKGMIYAGLAELLESKEERITYYHKAIDIYEQINDPINLCRNYFNLGSMYSSNKYTIQAEKYLLKADSLANLTQLIQVSAGVKMMLAQTYSSKQEYEKSIRYGQKALEESVMLGNTDWAATTRGILGFSYFKNGDINNAIKFLEAAYNELENSKRYDNTSEMANFISQSYAIQEDYETALEWSNIYNALKDSLNRIDKLKLQEEIESTYKTKEQENKIQLQALQLNQQRNTILIIALIAGLLILTTVLLWRNAQSRSKELKLLEELDKSKSRFFSNISHELKTPLSLITLPLEEVLKRGDNTSHSQEIKTAHRNSKKLLSLVNEILDLSKLEAGKLSLDEEQVFINSFFKRSFFAFESLAQVKNITLDYQSSIDSNLMASMDTAKIESVINNLVSNALKHSPKDSLIQLQLSYSDEFLRCSIIDQGKGIDEKHLTKIFDRYYQVEDDDELIGGTGIGLNYVKEIVKLYGGELKVSSQKGKGSQFAFTLALANAIISERIENNTTPTKDVMPTHSSNEKSFKLLVVEDNLEMSSFLKEKLSEDYYIDLAFNGLEALEQLKGNNFDLILSDVMMPDMDGFELLQTIRTSDDNKKTPFILLSAKSLEEDIIKGFNLGVDDYITKPFQLNELKARIDHLLNLSLDRKAWKKEDEANNSESQENKIEENSLLIKARTIVVENIANPDFRVSDLAQQMFYSQRQLERIIKLNTGFSPLAFIREIRLLKAYELLHHSQSTTVNEVRDKVGFESPSYFAKKFVDRFGIKPSELLGK